MTIKDIHYLIEIMGTWTFIYNWILCDYQIKPFVQNGGPDLIWSNECLCELKITIVMKND